MPSCEAGITILLFISLTFNLKLDSKIIHGKVKKIQKLMILCDFSPPFLSIKLQNM